MKNIADNSLDVFGAALASNGVPHFIVYTWYEWQEFVHPESNLKNLLQEPSSTHHHKEENLSFKRATYIVCLRSRNL